ncbi:MAG: hypothetical protein JW986_04960 [Methanotrichaceae archaeon]|nr:hypothetical protein [Methanotrichaceae archaeon]
MSPTAGGIAPWAGASFELRLGAEFCVYMLAGDEAGLSPGAVSQVQPQAPKAIDDMVVRFGSGNIWAVQAKAGSLSLSWEGEFGKALRQLFRGVASGQIDPEDTRDRAILAVEDTASGTVKAFGRWLDKAQKQVSWADLEEASTSKQEMEFLKGIKALLEAPDEKLLPFLKALHIRQAPGFDQMADNLRAMLVRSCGVPASQAESALDIILAQVAHAAPLRGQIQPKDLIDALGAIPALWPSSEFAFRILDRPREEDIDRNPVRPAYVERPELALADPEKGVLVVGKKGGGKTRALARLAGGDMPALVVYGDIREGQVEMLLAAARRLDRLGSYQLIWDDVQKSPKAFSIALERLARRGDKARVLASCRRENLRQVQEVVSEDLLGRLAPIDLLDLQLPQAYVMAGSVALALGLNMDGAAQEALARHIVAGDGGPLFALASAALIKGRLGGVDRVRAGDVSGLPPDLVDVWKRLYAGLEDRSHMQSLLRTLRLLQKIGCPAEEKLVQMIYKEMMERGREDLRKAIEALEGLWIRRQESTIHSHAVSLEAVPWEEDMLHELEDLARGDGDDLGLGLLRGSISSYIQKKVPTTTEKRVRKDLLQRAAELGELAIKSFRLQGHEAHLGTALSNTSNALSELAGLETSREGRQKLLQKAIDYDEEAIEICRGMGLIAIVSMSLNNASNRCSDLAGLETNRDRKEKLMQKAIIYIEEAINIRRSLGLMADVADSLNNASIRYSELAGFETSQEGRWKLLKKAVEHIEESIKIHRDLGLMANVATSLSNASNRYSELAGFETSQEKRLRFLKQGTIYIEEAISIRRDLGLMANVAISLSNASNRYSELAGFETSQEGRWRLLKEAIEYLEESIKIHRDQGLMADVAASLNSASNRYSELAGFETSQEGRWRLLKEAISSIEEAIKIRRGLGLKGDLAISLGNATRSYMAMAEELDGPERAAFVDQALEYIEEALPLFRELGPVQYHALSLRDAIVTHLAASVPDRARLEALLAEGEALADAMGNAEAEVLYRQVRAILEG